MPSIASEFGLRVTVGAWIDKNKDRNERELRSVIDLAKRHSNVNGIIVGNETIFRGELKVSELVPLIQRVKHSTNVPVTTGEIWHVWIEHPELVSAVDYIAAHILPYWEGFSEKQSVDQAILIYDKLRAAYPGKRIVIAEFGWPSAGYNLKDANPGRTEQAVVLRDFVSRAEAFGIDYNIVEAIDQPWKIFEGGVGPYWGIFDASRHAKFSWTGTITEPDHWKLAGIALLVSVLLSLPILAASAVTLWQTAMPCRRRQCGRRMVCSRVCLLERTLFRAGRRFRAWTWHLAVGAADHHRTVARRGNRGHCVRPQTAAAGRRAAAGAGGLRVRRFPFTSRPTTSRRRCPSKQNARRGRPRLDYANFECVLVINNTPDPAMWLPIEEHCRALGDRFKFVRADNMMGFKAGALRLAMVHTAADAEVIGIIDADYVVQQDWLKDLVPLFVDPSVGLVQAPQDHRDGARSVMHQAMNGEYAGFFDIGMVQRNEYNAIIVHGTMCLVRRAALEAAGGWSSDTICEDADLGLTLLELGWQAHYTNRRYGHGLLPDSFEAYKKQRHRWAYGGFQILKKHWRRFLPGASLLTRDQKREFALGWLNWLGAESLGVAVAIFNIIWVPVVAFLDIAVPDRILTIPILASFIVSVAHVVTLYRLRVHTAKSPLLSTVFAAMSVQWTVARAVAVWRDQGSPAVRAYRQRRTAPLNRFPRLLGSRAGQPADHRRRRAGRHQHQGNSRDQHFRGGAGDPELALHRRGLLATIESTQLNYLAYWRAVDTWVAELLGRRAPTVNSVTTVPAQVQIQVQVPVQVQEHGELVQ